MEGHWKGNGAGTPPRKAVAYEPRRPIFVKRLVWEDDFRKYVMPWPHLICVKPPRMSYV